MLKTRRLLLSPLRKSDANQLFRLLNDPEANCHNLPLPQPFTRDAIENWIESLPPGMKLYGIRRMSHHPFLIGVAGLVLHALNGVAEYTSCIGIPFRGRKYDQEALTAVVDFGFKSLNLHRIYTTTLHQGQLSHTFLQKMGMTYEGCLRQHVQFWGKLRDLHFHGLLRQQFAPAEEAGLLVAQ